MLKLNNIHTCYGEIEALKGVSLYVTSGEIVALIGSNGAGKSTVLMTISGILHPKMGEIEFMGKRIDNAMPYDIVSLGISHVPEGRRIFPHLTVTENLEMGAYLYSEKKWMQEGIAKAFHYFPVLKERIKQKGGTLSGGEQQMLAIGRALMSKPTLLLLDEPSLGLSPILADKILHIIKEINQEGITIILVEQNAKAALTLANSAYVMETGRIVLHNNNAKELLKDPNVKSAYLGD